MRDFVFYFPVASGQLLKETLLEFAMSKTKYLFYGRAGKLQIAPYFIL